MRSQLIFIPVILALAAGAMAQPARAQVTSPTATAAVSVAAAVPQTPAAAADDKPLPTAEEIVAKYEDATGGRDLSAKYSTRSVKGLYQTEDASGFAAIEEISAAPNKRYVKISFTNGVVVREVCDGKTAWLEDPAGGVHPFTGVALESRLRAASFSNGAGHLKLDIPGHVIGTAQVANHTTYQVQFNPEKNYTLVAYFDTTTGLIVRADDVFRREDGDFTVQTYMDDYRTIDGMFLPFKFRHVEKGNVFTVRVREIKNGPALDASLFVKPEVNANNSDQ